MLADIYLFLHLFVFITPLGFSIFLHNSLAASIPAVRGMMYYRRALELQAFLDMATEDGNEHSTAPSLPTSLDFVFCLSCNLYVMQYRCSICNK
jgi:hypothetical protein